MHCALQYDEKGEPKRDGRGRTVSHQTTRYGRVRRRRRAPRLLQADLEDFARAIVKAERLAHEGLG
jgi:hypothetical protein